MSTKITLSELKTLVKSIIKEERYIDRLTGGIDTYHKDLKSAFDEVLWLGEKHNFKIDMRSWLKQTDGSRVMEPGERRVYHLPVMRDKKFIAKGLSLSITALEDGNIKLTVFLP
jgi:hypothetical protein